ncbi:MAG: DUF389 domain-containing protein [Bacteroidia bacterium]|nr:DUF389 domain-containing protein [Bacteroidia bacterium]
MAEEKNISNEQQAKKVTEEAKNVKDQFGGFMTSVSDFIKHVTDLRVGLDKKGTITSVRKNVVLVGSNGWMLLASTFLASIGLDQNSVAVIIGAMLISPLMSPILGIGLSVGINDRSLLVSSLKSFGLAILISLVVSALYFVITPLGETTSEIVARTQPTLLDVLVGLFGGIAGIVAVSRKDQSAAIPGVAIATALMPPLCVAGFGIANGNAEIALGSFYLFLLNSFFIALSTYLIVRALRFPYKEHVDLREKRRATIFISLFVVLIIIPSGNILYELLKTNKQEKLVKNFVQDEFNNENHQSIKWELLESDSTNLLKVYMVGKYISEDSIKIYTNKLVESGISNTTVKLVQMDLPPQDNVAFANEIKLNILKTLEVNQQAQEEKTKDLAALQTKLDSLNSDTAMFIAMQLELKSIYPELSKIAIAKAQQSDFDTTFTAPILMLRWKNGLYNSQKRRNEVRVKEFFKARYKINDLQIVRF